MITVPELIKDKVKYLPHDGVSCDRLVISKTVFNHSELVRLQRLLEQIIYGEPNENHSN